MSEPKSRGVPPRAHTPDTSSSPPPASALPDNDARPATDATRAVGPRCPPTPNAAADTGSTPRPRFSPQARHSPRGGWPPEPVGARATQSTPGAPIRLRSPAPSGPSIARCQPATANAGTAHAPSRCVRPEALRPAVAGQPAHPQPRSCDHELPAARLSPAQRCSITCGTLTHLRDGRKWQMTL